LQATTIVPNSSFYLCFLDDIERPRYLVRILNQEHFVFVTGKRILEEVKKSYKYQLVQEEIERRIKVFKYLNYGEILKPFFSVEEIEKGEHEVIAISCILYIFKNDFLAIIDDEQAKKFLKRNFPEVERRVRGTVGFVEECYRCGIFSKRESIDILESIRNSKFRVKREIVDDTIKRVKED